MSGYKVYGRTAGSEQLLATINPNVSIFVDTGSFTPSGALPTVNIPTLPTTDQRGQPRIVNNTVDIGAFESNFQPQTIAFNPLASVTYGDADFAISATATSGLPVSFTASGDASVYQNSSGVWYVHITGGGMRQHHGATRPATPSTVPRQTSHRASPSPRRRP